MSAIAAGLRRRWLAILPLAIFAAAAVVFYMAVLHGPDVRPSALIGKEAPPLVLPPIPGSGRPGLTQADLGNGHVTVVNFWASWCAPCRLEQPMLMALSKRKGFKLIGVNYKDDPKLASSYLRDHGDPFAAVGLDASGDAGINWGISGVPETFVVGAHGHILAHYEGPLTPQAIKRLGLGG